MVSIANSYDLCYFLSMVSTNPGHKITPAPDTVSAGALAQLTFLNRNLALLADNQDKIVTAIKEESKLIRERQDQSDSRIADLEQRMAEEFKRSRAVTRLWASLGLSFFGTVISYLWTRISDFSMKFM
jgi:hypothetical protein